MAVAYHVTLFSIHMALAVTTISLGGYNLYMRFQRILHGSGGAMSSRLSLHRHVGQLLVWTNSGTMLTAYLVYLMLFVWYPGS